MTNLEKYTAVFAEVFELDPSEVPKLTFQAIPGWDSVGHMSLIAGLEEVFDVMMETDDIIDLNSFEKGKEILSKYDVVFE